MIKAVPFKYDESKVISKEQFDAHIKLYEGYIGKVNEIEQTLEENGSQKDSNATYSIYRGLKESETYALNGCILHELYFENMGGNTANHPLSDTKAVIDRWFGNFDNFVKDFKACAKSARGWAVFGYDHRTKSFINIMMDSHNLGYVALFNPILIIDMYEHAYFYDYKTDKDSYISNFLAGVNWQVVENRVKYLFAQGKVKG